MKKNETGFDGLKAGKRITENRLIKSFANNSVVVCNGDFVQLDNGCLPGRNVAFTFEKMPNCRKWMFIGLRPVGTNSTDSDTIFV